MALEYYKYVVGIILLAIAVAGGLAGVLTSEQVMGLVMLALALLGLKEVAEARRMQREA